MGKSLDDIIRKIEQERILKSQQERMREQRIQDQNEKARQEWIRLNRVYEKASSVSPSSSSSAGGGKPTEIDQSVPSVEILSFDPASFSPIINSITVYVSSGLEVTERGLIYGLNPDPDISEIGLSPSSVYHVDGGSGTGQFTLENVDVDFDVLSQTTYLRAYAINSTGVGYSDNVSWTPDICLAKGTKITLSNGHSKNIEDIEYSDVLLVWNFDDGNFDEAKPLWIKKEESTNKFNLLRFSDGSELKTISQHRIFNKEAGKFTYPMTDETPIGITTFNESGHEITLIEKSVVSEPIEYYNVITNFHINMFANGILTSCRYNNIYPTENMKFIKEERNRNDEEFEGIPSKYINGLRLDEQTYNIKEIKSYINRLQIHEIALQMA